MKERIKEILNKYDYYFTREVQEQHMDCSVESMPIYDFIVANTKKTIHLLYDVALVNVASSLIDDNPTGSPPGYSIPYGFNTDSFSDHNFEGLEEKELFDLLEYYLGIKNFKYVGDNWLIYNGKETIDITRLVGEMAEIMNLEIEKEELLIFQQLQKLPLEKWLEFYEIEIPKLDDYEDEDDYEDDSYEFKYFLDTFNSVFKTNH